MDYMVRYMNKDRAKDALENECLNRIIKAYKVHHPSMRQILQRFVEVTIDQGFDSFEIAKLINIAICDITSF